MEIAPDPRMETARTIARLLDESIPIPGTRFRIGLDSIIGLIPGVGDIAGGAFSAYLILVASRLGAPSSVLTRMLGNVVLDVAVGTLPLAGDVFDAGWKANTRNVRLLERYLAAPGSTRRASRAFVVAMLGILAAAVIGAVAVVALIIDAIV